VDERDELDRVEKIRVRVDSQRFDRDSLEVVSGEHESDEE